MSLKWPIWLQVLVPYGIIGDKLILQTVFQDLHKTLEQEVAYEKQRTLNSLFINGIDAFCSVAPIVIGGFMTYYNYLSATSFVDLPSIA